MPQNNTIDDAVKNADAWELAQNPVYRNLQQKLIERTFERDLFLCVHHSSYIAASLIPRLHY